MPIKRTFEIILETPSTPPSYLKEAAFLGALLTILHSYREFIAYTAEFISKLRVEYVCLLLQALLNAAAYLAAEFKNARIGD